MHQLTRTLSCPPIVCRALVHGSPCGEAALLGQKRCAHHHQEAVKLRKACREARRQCKFVPNKFSRQNVLFLRQAYSQLQTLHLVLVQRSRNASHGLSKELRAVSEKMCRMEEHFRQSAGQCIVDEEDGTEMFITIDAEKLRERRHAVEEEVRVAKLQRRHTV